MGKRNAGPWMSGGYGPRPTAVRQLDYWPNQNLPIGQSPKSVMSWRFDVARQREAVALHSVCSAIHSLSM
jgi:hypothetical protein